MILGDVGLAFCSAVSRGLGAHPRRRSMASIPPSLPPATSLVCAASRLEALDSPLQDFCRSEKARVEMQVQGVLKPVVLFLESVVRAPVHPARLGRERFNE